ncbi:MAG: hypothetical protein AB7G37_20620 [Solirubrobacteraceae bacterium]
MKPTPETARRLRDGSVELVEKRDGGGLIAVAREVGGKKDFVENVEIERVAPKGKAGHPRAAAGAAVAWQALAVATQQHYLVEISAGLDAIESAVDELGLDAERGDDAELATANRDLSRVERHLDTGAATGPADRALAEGTYAAAERIADMRLRKVEDRFDRDGGHSTDGITVLLRQLALAKRALAVAARSAWLITRLPDHDAQRALNDLEHYSTRFDDLRLRVNALVVRTRELCLESAAAWARHEQARSSLGSNVRNLKDPLKSLAAAPKVGDRYLSARAAARKVARRDDAPAERATFHEVSRGDIRRPKHLPRPTEEQQAMVDDWSAAAMHEGPQHVDVLVVGDEVRLIGSGAA